MSCMRDDGTEQKRKTKETQGQLFENISTFDKLTATETNGKRERTQNTNIWKDKGTSLQILQSED